jgi:hypothetical protein
MEDSVQRHRIANPLAESQNWKKRWFVLRTEKMAYYKDEKVSSC